MSNGGMDKEALAFADELIIELNLGQESRAQLAERIDKFRKQVLTNMVTMLLRSSEARKKDDEPFGHSMCSQSHGMVAASRPISSSTRRWGRLMIRPTTC